MYSIVHTWRISRPDRAAAAQCVAAEVAGFVGIDPLTVHLVGLGGLLQLGQNETAAPLRGSVHLKHLPRVN